MVVTGVAARDNDHPRMDARTRRVPSAFSEHPKSDDDQPDAFCAAEQG
jgi:hypothetical protein